MARGLAELDWEDPTKYAPAVVTALAMPLTCSIDNGIGLSVICYAAVKVLCGRLREGNLALTVLAALFVIKYAVL